MTLDRRANLWRHITMGRKNALASIVLVSLLAACGGGVSGTTTTTAPATTTTTVVTTTTLAATTTTLPEFPPARETLEHGGEAWSVILAASEHENDPAIAAAITAATDAGYDTAGPTDAGCDQGSLQALGIDDDDYYLIVSVYFDTEEDAIAARDAFLTRGVEGTVALVQTYCLD